jgi:hypothetical protein
LATFKALKANDTKPLRPWVVYWLIISLSTAIEHYLYFLLKFIPFFGLLKVYFSLWLILPQTKGAEFLYSNYLAPLISDNEGKIDGLVNGGKPWELVQSAAQYAGYNINPTASSPRPTETRSYLDMFIDNFASEKKHQQISLAESLLGVFSALPSGEQGGYKTPVDQSTNTSIDFDLVGKEEIEKIVETAKDQIDAADSWMSSWWSGEKPKTT